MIRTQIQLPEDVYRRAKRLADAREISLAELARRGLEYILSVYPVETKSTDEWQLPKPMRLGWKGLSEGELKEEAQRSAAEEKLARR